MPGFVVRRVKTSFLSSTDRYWGFPTMKNGKRSGSTGCRLGISYLDAVAALAASRIEEGARCGNPVLVQAKMAKLPSDINLKIEEYAMRSITDNKKKVDVRGPVFLTVRSTLE